jgi:hypothetical protein
MEREVKEIKSVARKDEFDYHVYMNPEIQMDINKLHKISLLYDKWVAFIRTSHDKNVDFETNEEPVEKDDYIKVLEREAYSISNNLQELTNLLVEVCYGYHGENSKEFCWKMFGAEGILRNLLARCRGFIQIPIADEAGRFDYLGKKYSVMNLDVEKV